MRQPDPGKLMHTNFIRKMVYVLFGCIVCLPHDQQQEFKHEVAKAFLRLLGPHCLLNSSVVMF